MKKFEQLRVNSAAEEGREMITERPEHRIFGVIEGRAPGAIVEAVGSLARIEDEIHKSPDITEEQRGVLKRIYERVKNLTKRLTQVSLLGVVAMAANYEVTHPEIEKQISKDGAITYRHPDATTNHILNYLVGAEELSEQERLAFVKSGLVLTAEEQKVDLPEGFADLDRAGLLDFFMKNFLRTDQTREEIEAELDELLSEIPTRFEFNPEVYDALWAIEKESGAPKVRWTVGVDRGNKLRVNVAHYNPLTNTAYLFPAQPHEVVPDEFAHAKQFADNPVLSYLKGAQSLLRIASKVVTQGKSIGVAQLEEYDIPESLEFEAHKEIEPELREKLMHSTDKK